MTNKILLLLICLITMTLNLKAQKVVKLWEGQPPVSNELTEPEISENDGARISNVSEAELYIYLPENNDNTHMAIVICPGGGYGRLAMNHEGHDFAKWLNSKGIAAIILKYRMPNKHKDVPINDAWQAMRYVREHAQEMNIDADKVGIAGFSAGGHLASTASTHFATSGTNTRPNFSILFYPVITMMEGTHEGSKYNLLGENPTAEDLQKFSNETQVPKDAPPTILLLSDDDKAVPPINSYQYYASLKKQNIPAAMYIFPEGGHGWGMRDSFKYHEQMLTLLEMWLNDVNKK